MFSANSVVVKAWVNLVKEGIYSMDQVPELGNLREQVALVISDARE